MVNRTLHLVFALLFTISLDVAAFTTACNADTGVLTKEEAKEILKKIAPDVNIVSVEKSAVEGLWEVAITGNAGNKGVVYLDSTKKFLIQGSIINLATKANLTKEKFDEINKVDVSKIPLENSLIVGDPEAKQKIFVFADPDCPYCAKFHDEMKKVSEKRKDIAFYVKLFPLNIHPQARDKSIAIRCESDNDRAVKMLEDAYAHKDIPKATCASSGVDENIKLGESLGINATPTVIFADGKIRYGMSAEEVIKVADGLIASGLKKESSPVSN
jgi:thiol:disulfide interchange protein DsbC